MVMYLYKKRYKFLFLITNLMIIFFDIQSNSEFKIETENFFDFEKNPYNLGDSRQPKINSQSSYIREAGKKRKWSILVYIAADNDLYYFAWNNIKQLASSANDNVYIIVQLNEPGKNKKTQRYLIEKNKAILLNKDNQQKLDSGDPQTLIDFCTYSIKYFPSDNYMLVLSDHGSGIIDRSAARLINPTELFVLNPSNLMLELDRSIEFLDFLRPRPEEKKPILHAASDYAEFEYENQKGLCFDETYQTYFTNQKLEYALKISCQEASKILNKNDFKFDVLGIDACLMQMAELADLVKKFASILVASEEVELGPGWRYDKILKPLSEQSMDFIEFSRHIVKAYEETYAGITNDYTLSAINLDNIDDLSKNINTLAEILINMIQNQKNNSVKNIIKKCKSNVAFEEPSYVDLASFYKNMKENIDECLLKDLESLKPSLTQCIDQGIEIMQKMILENVSGSNIKYAKGISIYFPEKRIHNSYRKTNFAQSNQWLNFLLYYIS